uniref:non-specific serine/threonine protein kinase n=1 Tax=Anopheles stephensi TaxID=30069 RepID=A0A182YCU6_ANOST
MGGKADTKPPQQCTAKRISRRSKKKPTEHQRQPKPNAGGPGGRASEQHDTDQQTLASPAGGAPTGGKRYQSTRTQAASQRRDRARKLAAETERTGGSDGRDGLSPHELANVPADMRISKLLRRLVGEMNPHLFLEVCDRLEVVILDPSNASYVRKSFDILANTVNTILEGGLRECYDRVAQLFGMMLYVLLGSASADTSALRNWTSRYLNQSKSIRRSALIALRQTVLLDRDGHKLDGGINWLLGVLQEILETTNVLDVFVLVTDVMVELADRYPRPFSSHFSDIVDIVVGWQLESTQSTKVKVHCARVLLAFQPYWCEQRDVTFNLLEQFSEDIDGQCGDIDYSDEQQRDDGNRQFGALLTAFNSVMKCLGSSTGEFLLQEDEMMRFDCCSVTIVENVFRLLESPPSGLAIAAICEFVMLKLMLHSPTTSTDTEEIFSLLTNKLVQYANTYSDEQVGALVHLLLRYIDAEGSEKQQCRVRMLLPLIFQEGSFYALRYRQNRTVQQVLLLLCHHILTLKHVDILQTAYSAILADIDDALGKLRSVGSRTPSRANILRLQYRIQFSLLLLSPLAMTRNSIFITWTLKKQPVLHVLLDRLAPTDGRLWDQHIHTHLHYAVLLTAFNHCSANNHFISSSSLLQPANAYGMVDRFRRGSRSESSATDKDAPPESPTADHFGLVLRFLGTILGQWKRVRPSKRYESHRTNLLLLLLDWCLAIVTQTTRYHDILHDCDDFNQLLVHVGTIAVEQGSESETIGLRCADCLDAACQYMSLHVSAYQAIAEACCVHLCSVYGSLRTRYTVLFSKLPLRHSLRQVNEFTGVNRRRWEQIGELKNGLYQGGGGYGLQHSATLRMADLRSLFNRITFSRDGAGYAGGYLHELLTRSFNQPSRYGEMALRDLRCLIPWAQWEAAQLCVNHKLRTPFGKPQSTFLRIESIVKQCARILALTDKFPVRDIRTSIVNQRHARILLGFLEALEKSIYNAAEGTAYALPAPEKPARTFFRLNQQTCAEWFTRIRTAVDLVALHCMEPEMVIRYSEAVLRELVAAGKTSDPIFEHMLMSLVWALVRNWESDALYGVYVWSKRLTGRKYSWIRMAAEEASGHRETAASGFRGILADPGSVGMDRHIRDFIVDQTILCLLFTGDYRQLYEFLLAEEGSGTPRATIPLITVTAAQISSIIRYEETHDVSVIDISQWELVDVGNNIPNDFSCHKMICAVENSLSGIILQDQIEQRERMIDASTELIQCYLQECLLTRCREYLFQLTITNHILYKIAQRIRSPNVMSGSTEGCGLGSLNVEKFYGTLTLMRLLAWSEFLLADAGDGFEGEQQNIDLRLDMVSIGRKEKNYALSRRELEKYYHKSNLVGRLEVLADGEIGADRQQQHRLTLEQVASALMKSDQPRGLWDENLSRAVYEHCKWLYCQSGKRLEAIDFAACATAVIDGELTRRRDEEPKQTAKHSERVARFLLTISDWMAGEAGEPCANELPSVTRLGQLLPSIDAKPLTVQHAGIFGPSDRLIGTLLQGAVDRCPPLAKAWFALGSWLYRWGKRIVEHSAADGSSARISVDQVAAILAGPTVSMEDCERIVGILNDHEPARIVIGVDSDRDAEDADELDLDSSATIGSIGLLDALHRAMPGLEGNVPQESLHAIIDIWRSNHRAVYGYYEAAAEAYFRFLQLSSGRNDTTSEGVDSERARSVTVTLRLLRLIVKHALGLKEVLEEGLATTPSEPWRVITPQLFSRLAHHEPYVRRRVSELLCRVAKDAPHLIIFPAVVGSVQEESSQLAVVDVLRDGVEEVSSRINEPVDQSQSLGASGLGFCFNALLDILSREIPDTVKQVQTLVHELRRISLLWEELWVMSLQQIYADYTKRMPTFESEYRRLYSSGQLTEQRRTLLAEKHRLLLRPLLFVLEQLYGITSRKAETSHERHFQARYHRYIRHMLAKLREPADFTLPIEGWNRFRTLYTQLKQRSQKRFSFFLRLGDVSPNLLRLSNTAIAMPGIDTTLAGSRQPILIRSVDNNIQILPTKTRPKKLTFCGNDGRRFGYLSKGLEDLHLDERIMQFLSIANLMMTKSIDCNGNVTHYRAEHYSVIPLGPRSGLITWVDNTVPIFSLYKKWQQREALQKKETKGGGSAALQSSELFYNKLKPLLQSHGLKPSASRREWPLAVLKQVLAELQQETPRDLLAKELWCHSATASSWRQVIRSYSLSLAVMSVIGYIIGLGDRHLDNVLVKLATGEIVHIDYNVCFEKGKTLRVPEKVPFRMTPNLEEALGLTGIEGTFRLACEHVLKSLKKGRETLLTLLEAFVYDPLVDWAIGEEIGSGLPMTATDITVSTAAAASNAPGTGQGASRYISQAKKQLDREVTRDTLAVRFAECRTDWYQNRDDMLQHLICLQKLLRDLREVRTELVESERLRASLSQQLQLIGEVEYLDTAFSSHPLASLTHRLSMRSRLQEVYANQREKLAQQAKLFSEQLEDYDKYRHDMQDQEQLEMLRYELADVPDLVQTDDDTQHLLIAFLPKDDPGYVQYSFARTELSELQRRAAPVAEKIVQLLEQYGVQLSPGDSLLDHPLHHYANWYKQLAESNPEPAAALETTTTIVREHEKTRKLQLAAQSKQKEDEQSQTDLLEACVERIMVLNRALIDAERAIVDGVEEPIRTVSNVASHLLEECSRHQGLIADSTLDRCLHRTVAEYKLLEQLYEMSVPLQDGYRRRDGASDREMQLNEQFEQLVLNVEHCLRAGQWDSGAIGEAGEIARMLVDSWTELMSEDGLGDDVIWHYNLPEPTAQHISELTETLVQAAKLQTIYELRYGALPQQTDETSASSSSSISVDRFIKRFVRLRLAGRGPLAALSVVQISAGSKTAGTRPALLTSIDSHWLQDLTEAVQSLAPIPTLLLTSLDQLKRHTEALRNRLAWASAAHPPLCPLELPVAFEQSSSHCVESSSKWIQSLERILRYGQIVLRYESTRHCDESSLASEFGSMVERWQKTLTGYTVRGASFVSPTEEALVELLDPEGSIDPTWISNVRALIDDMTDQVLTKLARLEQDERTLQTALQAAAKHLLTLVHKHDDVVGDIRSLLRTQLRIGGSTALRDYLQRYRRFLDLLHNAHEAVLTMVTQIAQEPSNTTGTSWTVDDAEEMVDELLALLHDVFEQLFQFDEPPDEDADQGEKETADGEREEDEEDDDVSGTDGASSSVHLHDPAPPPADRKEQKQKEQKEQKRNAYAVSVWRRIRMKLEGRDPDPVRRCGVTEQVAWMIDEAMDPSNLAVLYEGWTPWV